ncbi:metacaspase type II, MCP1 [Chondrus crispus]|uniref:Metacaspase type II, MCP1 n=1 Tax=Chondrus crispus TaxID=2769 RepID=R7QIW3_CHOCR|nr:metacaspase type II, MCP1 [Chondrus crispus]CDF37365.1 metacaspase type II, MCP1 [Chondrus crispus]|eukprot:XP_005717184.1 metacaspase type II, MCP1 [Chondrus crispus]
MGKYAVVIGVNYTKNPEAALQGCCNDARLMVNLLHSKGFEDEDIKLLVDDDDSNDSPNHVNVKKALDWLCTGRSEGDTIFMHFSGHGTQVPADDDDVEEDKLDEAICLEELFLMADDDLKQYFSQLPEGVRATVVMDCCHSGSMLDGQEVAIQGAKDEDSAVPPQESDDLVNVLGGSREAVSNRSLPISTICNVMSQKLGSPVSPTGSGVNGAMAQVFGGTAGKLMMKFALGQMAKQDGGSSNPLVGMLGGMMGGKSTSSSGSNPLAAMMGGGSTSSGSNPLAAMMGGGGSTTSSNPLASMMGGGESTTSSNPLASMMGGGESTTSSNPLASMMGGGGSTTSSNPLASMMGGGGSTTSSNPLASMMGGGGSTEQNGNPMGSLMGALGGGNASSGGSNPLASMMGGGATETETAAPQSQNPMAMLSGLMGGMGLGGQEDSGDAPAYNPAHQPMSRDVCTLITGCQASETSADVRPAGEEAFGALTKTLTTLYEKNPETTYHDLVSNVRSELSRGGFKQNPCLECSETMAHQPFIC